MTRTRVGLTLGGLLLLGLLVGWKHDRLKHLAVPVLSTPAELPGAPAQPIAETEACDLERVESLGTRITALLTASDGARWAGTFDRGVFRGERRLAGSGREHFVNALVEHRGSIWAATYGGVLQYDLDGALRSVRLPGVATEALVVHDGALVAGTVRGLYRDFAAAGDPTLRATSLAVSGGRLWVGTQSGVYEADGTWHPLVFGPEAAATNVALALAPYGAGVLALTDNGGLVDVQPGREVRCLRFTESRANEGNPGAARVDGERVLVGTQGGGLLEIDSGRVLRPRGWPLPIVSALSDGLVGDGAGDVWGFSCASARGSASGVAGRAARALR